MSFEYNSSGLRTKKIVGDKTTEYYYSGNLLVAQYDGEIWIKFSYAPNGEVVGFDIHSDDGTYYDYCYYLKNVQGDILGIYSTISTIFREYTYDAWGNITGVYDEYGNPVKHFNDVAYYNPFRYRGYYYDNETGLYYLQSRYYNPEWGRFVSADAFADTGQGLNGTNVYAYCLNNPVNFVDPTGNYGVCSKCGKYTMLESCGWCPSQPPEYMLNPAYRKYCYQDSSESMIDFNFGSLPSNPTGNYLDDFAVDFSENSLIVIADDFLKDYGSSSMGVVSSFSLVVTLVDDYSNYKEDPVKMTKAMAITLGGTVISVVGGKGIAAIPGIGLFWAVTGGVVLDVFVGNIQDYLKDQL